MLQIINIIEYNLISIINFYVDIWLIFNSINVIYLISFFKRFICYVSRIYTGECS